VSYRRAISSLFTVTTSLVIYTLSLHDALPICRVPDPARVDFQFHEVLVGTEGDLAVDHLGHAAQRLGALRPECQPGGRHPVLVRDRKSTRLNSSHVKNSYAVFCLKKKKRTTNT